jgi:hypothetical protein
MPWLNVDFWDVLTIEDKHFDFPQLARSIKSMKYAERIKDRGSEYADFVEVLDLSNNQIFGGGARIRKTGLPGGWPIQAVLWLEWGVFRWASFSRSLRRLGQFGQGTKG